jgi:hypothetical protein
LVPNAAKRVVAYRFSQQPLEGYVNAATFLLNEGVELLTIDGVVQVIPYGDLKALCFTGETARFDLFRAHPTFERRPRFPGLWTRFTLRDGDQIDGVLPSSLTEWPKYGFTFTPPRASSLRQKVFIPREALNRTDFQGVIGAGSRRRDGAKRTSEDQMEMFD